MPPTARRIAGVDDSKKLKPAVRERLAGQIRSGAVAWALGAASVREIEQLNILQATILAMRRALDRLVVRPEEVLVDGRPVPTLGYPHQAIVGGDASCYSIACASILAKVTRDRLMQSLAERHPGYGWETNVGYGAPVHLAGLREWGVTRHHRVGFLGRIVTGGGVGSS
jgi:ribonuclease HII